MIKEDHQEARQINVVLNWFEALKRLALTGESCRTQNVGQNSPIDPSDFT